MRANARTNTSPGTTNYDVVCTMTNEYKKYTWGGPVVIINTSERMLYFDNVLHTKNIRTSNVRITTNSTKYHG